MYTSSSIPYIILTYIILLGLNGLIAFNICQLTNCFLTLKDKKIYKVSFFCSQVLVGSAVIYVSDPVNILGFLVFYILLITLCYKDKFLNKISVVFLLYPILVTINAFFTQLYLRFYKYPVLKPYLEEINVYFRYLCTALIWWALYHLLAPKVKATVSLLTPKLWLLIDIIALTSFITSIYVIIYTDNDDSRYQAILMLLICLASNIAMFFIIDIISKSLKIETENRIHQLQANYYTSLEKDFDTIRKIRHDMNNHLHVIYSLAEDNQTEEISSYIQSISSHLSAGNIKIFSSNTILNAVLNNKYEAILQANINFAPNINLPDNLPIDAMDLCSIFSNTLDNALEASLRLPDHLSPYIQLKARFDRGYFVYYIENQIDQQITEQNGHFISSKDNKSNHGFGLLNIQDIVKKYNGDIQITYDTTKFSLTLIIPILSNS